MARKNRLTFKFKIEGDQWIGVCKELGTAAQADTLVAVMDELCEFVELQLTGLEQVGEPVPDRWRTCYV